MGTKRIALFVFGLILVIILLFSVKPRNSGNAPLRFATWTNYFPEDLLKEFTSTTGIKLELSYISSNEELFAKFKAGATGFDLILPSDYMVRQMSQLDMLLTIDHRLIPNVSQLDDFYKHLPHDPELKFSVPFTWGTTGIAINTEQVAVPPDGVGWKMLFESPDFRHTSLLDDMREVFGAAFLFRGHSLVSKDKPAMEQAKVDIQAIKKKILMFSSEPKQFLVSGEVNIAHIYSTDGIGAGIENPKIKYFIPKEGATLWIDNFAIPKASHKVAEAQTFINFFLDPKNAVRICLANHLATPNKAAREALPLEIRENPMLYPPENVMKRLEMLDEPGESLIPMNRLWTDLKSS
jgi:spermidine/putrescine transport system substrate-binding protein